MESGAYARQKSREDAHHFERNRAGTKLFFSHYSTFTFTFKQGQYTNTDQIKHFQCILYILTLNLNSKSYIQCILVKVYTHFYALPDWHCRGC